MDHRLKRLLTGPFIVLAALLLWFWEWLWEPLERFMGRLGRLPVLRRIETWIAAAPPYVALACFVIPGLLLLPFKVAGLYFLAHGAPAFGLLSFLLAKVVGTALVARIFALTKPQLLAIAWFARAYTAVAAFRERVFGALHRHPLYRWLRIRLLRLGQRLSGLRHGLLFHLRCRWRAIRRHRKRRRDLHEN